MPATFIFLYRDSISCVWSDGQLVRDLSRLLHALAMDRRQIETPILLLEAGLIQAH